MIKSNLKFKIWYFLGWVLNMFKSFFYKIAYLFRVIKKIGFFQFVKELKRRVLLHIDFIFYPYLINKLNKTEFKTIKQILDFSYNKSGY